MRSKKAMLLTEEVLKIVVAVIGLVLLSYFLISFFSSDAKEKKQRDAAATMDQISWIVSNPEISSENITALQPQGWTLFSFTGEEKRPNQCTTQNCVCICKKVIGDVFDRQIKKCTKEGTCLVISNLQEFEDIKIEKYGKGTTSINIKKIGGSMRFSII